MTYTIEFIKKENRGLLCSGKWYNYTEYHDKIVDKLKKGDTIDIEFWEGGKKIKTIIPLTKAEVIKKDFPDFEDLDDKAKQVSKGKSTYEVKNDIDIERLKFEKLKQEYFYRERCQERAIQFMQGDKYPLSKESLSLVCRLAHQLYTDLMIDNNWLDEKEIETKVNDVSV